MEERIQKIIARAGLASRRRAEEMMRSGLVTVNGHTITELGSKADIGRDHIKVAGKLLRAEAESAHVYLVLNKPPEVVATMSDPEGRPSLRDMLHGVPERVFPVGRLEYHSTGLVFLTNDGDLANKILKEHNLPQVYQFKVKSLLTFAEIEELSRATGARITRMVGKEMPWYLITLSDARRDQLRDRLFRTGHPVEKIRRVSLGGIELGSLAPGQHRALTSEELSKLRHAVTPGTAGAAARPAGFRGPHSPQTKNFQHAKPVRWTKPGSGKPRDTRTKSFGRPGADRKPNSDQKSSFNQKPGFDRKPNYNRKPSFGRKPDTPAKSFGQPGTDQKSSFNRRPNFGRKPDAPAESFGRPGMDKKTSFGQKPGFDRKPNFNRKPNTNRKSNPGPRNSKGPRR